jgi:hypothetical protein
LSVADGSNNVQEQRPAERDAVSRAVEQLENTIYLFLPYVCVCCG